MEYSIQQQSALKQRAMEISDVYIGLKELGDAIGVLDTMITNKTNDDNIQLTLTLGTQDSQIQMILDTKNREDHCDIVTIIRNTMMVDMSKGVSILDKLINGGNVNG